MTLVTLVPTAAVQHIRDLLPRYDLRPVDSWAAMDNLIENGEVEAVVFDPTTPGPMTDASRRVLRKHPSTVFLAYVRATPENLKAILSLSKDGLRQVLVVGESDTDRRFVDAVRRARARQLGFDLLAEMQVAFQELPAPLSLAVDDLFDHPRRYCNVSDLAREARMSARSLFRHLSDAGLKTPGKLVLLAKTIHAYVYLRWSSDSVRQVSYDIGYSNTRACTRQLASVLDCVPGKVSRYSHEEIQLRLLEWMSKPPQLRMRRI